MPTNPDLMRIFGFTAADLEANRSGKMSERQTKQLKEESDADRIAVNGLICAGLLVAGIIAFTYRFRPQELLTVNTISQIIGIGIILVWLYLRYRSHQRSNKLDLQWQHAGQVQGIATWNIVIRQKEYIYQITVDGKVFRVEKQTYNAFETFMQLKNKYIVFRIYFAPETSRILSVEIIAS